MPAFSLSTLIEYKWRIAAIVLAVAAMYYIVRPQPDPREVILGNLYDWAQQLEKAPAEGSASADASPAALSQAFGQVRNLVRDAFTDNAIVRSRRGHQEQGRDAIAKWCFTLRHQADSLSISLSDISIEILYPDGGGAAAAAERSALPDGSSGSNREAGSPAPDATATLIAHLNAQFQGNTYTQSYRCEVELVRDSRDRKWRISQLTGQPVPANTPANSSPAGTPPAGADSLESLY